MKRKILYIVLILILFCSSGFLFAQETMLKGGISVVPDGFYGLWRVKSERVDTNSPVVFKEKSLDLWNLLRQNNVIMLSNPFSGASAEVTVNSSEQNHVVFTKVGNYEGKILTDTVSITIDGEFFTGFDELELVTKSNIDGHVMKVETAKYSVKGEKITD